MAPSFSSGEGRMTLGTSAMRTLFQPSRIPFLTKLFYKFKSWSLGGRMKEIIFGVLFLFSASTLATKVEIKYGSEVIISMKDISEARPIESADGKWDIFLQLKPKATKRFAAKTKKLQGKKLDIILENEVISSPIIQTSIATGSIQLDTKLTKEQAIETAGKITEELKSSK